MLAFDQEVNSIERYPAVVTHDTATAIGIRKTGDNFIFSGKFHLRCIDIKDTLVVCFVILGKNLMQFFTGLVAIGSASLLRHADSAVRHECTLQRLVRLQSHYLLQFFQILVNVGCPIGSDSGDHFRLHVQNTAFGAFLFL